LTLDYWVLRFLIFFMLFLSKGLSRVASLLG
jgi:hypothetical protein